MGAWGIGPFDNDDAQDFVLDLADVPDDELERRLAEALALPSGYVEVPEASIAVAAAALVAVGAGMAPPESPTVCEFVASRSVPTTTALREAAKAALDRVASQDSELWELWQDAGEADQVLASHEAINGRL
jgi:hypothetical protein